MVLDPHSWVEHLAGLGVGLVGGDKSWVMPCDAPKSIVINTVHHNICQSIPVASWRTRVHVLWSHPTLVQCQSLCGSSLSRITICDLGYSKVEEVLVMFLCEIIVIWKCGNGKGKSKLFLKKEGLPVVIFGNDKQSLNNCDSEITTITTLKKIKEINLVDNLRKKNNSKWHLPLHWIK